MVNFEKLKEKGWDDEHIARAKYILEKDPGVIRARTWNYAVYWFCLIVAIIGNFVVNLALIPVFLGMDTITVFLTLLLVGGSFGLLFTIILLDLEMVDPKHHVIAGIFLPILAGIVSYVTVSLSNELARAVHTELLVTQNVIFVPLVYVLAFTLPYLLSVSKDAFKTRNTRVLQS